MQDDFDRRSMPWMNIVIDWEGVAAAGAAFLAALLLGWIWAPLFWIGFAATVAALAAGRWSHRSPPDIADGVVAPCDGVVVSVERGEPPTALRMVPESLVRIRISSAPFTTNKIYAPITSGVDLISLSQGEPSVPVAFRAEDDGLTRAYITFESAGEQAGIALASGGLGPRIDLHVEVGDIVRLGKPFATRRLGGWCDLYLPASLAVLVWPGQTLVGGETVIGRLREEAAPGFTYEAEDAELEETQRKPEPAVTGGEAAAAEAVAEEDFFDDYPEPDEVSAPEDPAAIFARLREAARKHGESD